MITDAKSHPKQQPRLNSMGKQNNVRKMSTMPEEDGSDDAEPDIIRVHQDPDSDSPEEHGRLLTNTRKILVTPASTGSTGSTGNGVKRSSSGNSSTDSVHEKLSRGCQSGRLAALDAGSRDNSYRDNSIAQSGRISRGLELYGSRHHRYQGILRRIFFLFV